MESPFQRRARDKYRFATVVGDGPHGVVSFCCIEKRVGLFATAEQAQRAAAGRCKCVPCTGKHKLEDFEPLPLPIAPLDSPADYEAESWERKLGVSGL
jgi:hypothetical protein